MEDWLELLSGRRKVDFASWMSYLNRIEEESPDDIQKLSAVYDRFLSEYPLCYCYWVKYAGHTIRLLGANEAVEVYERAIEAATYSVDMWASYCSFAVEFYVDPDDVRRLFERGLSVVGKDYSCHILWDKYLEFERSQKSWSSFAHIYIRTLRFPSKELHHYYESFKDMITDWEEEIEGHKNGFGPSTVDSRSKSQSDSNVSEVIDELFDNLNYKSKSNIFNIFISIAEGFYEKSSKLDNKINRFEADICRPHFHPEPLDDPQLNNWHQYLDFVEMQEDFDWTVKLYERCLIPCANYQEFWIRYAEHMEARGGREIANLALERASSIFLKEDTRFRLYCARFKERTCNILGARASLLLDGSFSSPNFIENLNRQANMERRLGNIEAASHVYVKAISMAEEGQKLHMLSLLYTHFSQFTYMATRSTDAAREIFLKGIHKYSQNKSLLEALIKFMITHGDTSQITSVDSIVASAITPNPYSSQTLSMAERMDISSLFIEFVDLCGSIHEIEKAWDRHRKLFPDLLRPYSNGSGVHENGTLDKANNEGDTRIKSIYHKHSDDNDVSGLYKNLSSPEGGKIFLTDETQTNIFEPKNDANKKSDQMVHFEDALTKSIQKVAEVHMEETDDSSGEKNRSTKSPTNSLECSKIISHVQEQSQVPLHGNDSVEPVALENLSTSSTIEEKPKSANYNASKISGFPESDEPCMCSNSTACTSSSPQTDHGHVSSATNSAILQVQSSPLAQAVPCNVATGAISGDMPCGVKPSASYTSHHHQQPAVVYSSGPAAQITITQGYQSRQQSWQVQNQQYSQEHGQNMASSAHAYQSGTFSGPQNFQQVFPSGYHPQGTIQTFPESQPQWYHYPQQGGGQYESFQSGQACPPDMWYYYQQQLYNMQMQQQNLQMQQQQQQQHQEKNEQPHQRQHNSAESQSADNSPGLNASKEEQQSQQQAKHLHYEHQHEHQSRGQQEHCQPDIQNYGQLFQMQHQEQMRQQQGENPQLHSLQQQQMVLLQQQQILMQQQQQQYQLYFQQQQQQQPQVHITPLQIEALSQKYLQGQEVVQNVDPSGPGGVSSQQKTSSDQSRLEST